MKPSQIILPLAVLGAVGIGGYIVYTKREEIGKWFNDLFNPTVNGTGNGGTGNGGINGITAEDKYQITPLPDQTVPPVTVQIDMRSAADANYKNTSDLARLETIPRGKAQVPGLKVDSPDVRCVAAVVEKDGYRAQAECAEAWINWILPNGSKMSTRYNVTPWEFCNKEGTPCRERLGINIPCPAFDAMCLFQRARGSNV